MNVHYHNDALHEMSLFCDSLNLPLCDTASLHAALFSSDTTVEDSSVRAFSRRVFLTWKFSISFVTHLKEKRHAEIEYSTRMR